jgi:RHS repeat-associated protein
MTNSAGVTTDYIYDGSMLVREMQVAGPNNFPNIAAGTLVDTATYLQGPTGPSYRRNDITGIPSWYVYNGLGSVVGEVDPAGNYTASGEYDVYGAPRASTQSGTFDTRQLYVGQLGHQTDPETGGLIYMQQRFYDTSIGRFNSEDPAGHGSNWYTYCNDDPINETDPNGLFSPIDLVTGTADAAIEELQGALMAKGCENWIEDKILGTLAEWGEQYAIEMTEDCYLEGQTADQDMAIGVEGKWKLMWHMSEETLHDGQAMHIQLSVSPWGNVARAFFTATRWIGEVNS